MTAFDDTLKRLAEPFPAEVINFKPQVLSKDKTRALAVAYIDARDVAQRLDDALGPSGWQNDHKPAGDGQFFSGIGVLNTDAGEWLWRWDKGFVSTKDGGDGKKGDEGMTIKG